MSKYKIFDIVDVRINNIIYPKQIIYGYNGSLYKFYIIVNDVMEVKWLEESQINDVMDMPDYLNNA